MGKTERWREEFAVAPDLNELKRRVEQGWKAASVDWYREVPAGEPEGVPGKNGGQFEDVPFGFRVADDCQRLQEEPSEQQVLMLMMELIVQDRSLNWMADELNRRGFRTRGGKEWSPPAVFDLLPRLIETGPRLLAGPQWAERRRNITMVPSAPATDLPRSRRTKRWRVWG
jgi:Recombinase